MATSGPTPVPPTTIHTSHSISQSSALDFLSAYMDRASNDPSLQSNSTISQEGPKSRNVGGHKGPTERNLERLLAGLAGEFREKDEDFQAFEMELKGKRKREGKWFEEEIAAFTGKRKGKGKGNEWSGKGKGKGRGAEKEEVGWEDKRAFEAQQQVEEGKGDDEAGGGMDDAEVVEVGEDGMPPKIDKEERKRKKKEKRKAEKRAKATED